jgi:alpha-beta hydrolase superfamily lysophospholipase
MTTLDTLSTPEKVQDKAGLNIAYRAWLPASVPNAVVMIVPGFNSHSGYYGGAAEYLNSRGFAVYAVDLRGRGLSDGERFYVDTMEDYADDIAAVMGVASRKYPGKKIFLFGHSAGGVAACIYTLDHQDQLAGLVCASFAYQVPAPDFAIAALKGLSHLAPHAHVLALANRDFSRDATVVTMMDGDPLIAHETQPTRTMAALAYADDRLRRDFSRFTLPLLILHGTADKATKPSGSEEFYGKAASRDKTLKLYEGHYHDLLNDIGKEAVLADIAGWIEARA